MQDAVRLHEYSIPERNNIPVGLSDPGRRWENVFSIGMISAQLSNKQQMLTKENKNTHKNTSM